MRIFRVGGSVRDSILGINSKDIDIAVEAHSFEIMKQEVLEQGCTIFLESPQFFTIRAKHPTMGAVDFSLCRKDGIYRDGRHPDDVQVGTIYDDLARRDFTMNAIAIDLGTEEVLDPFGGMADINNKIIKAVGDVNARFDEDKLRALRAVRFVITKGMRLHHTVGHAIDKLKLHDFDGVSTDRIRDELYKMFAHNTYDSVAILTKYDIFWELIRDRGMWLKPTIEKI
jgi:tRNA nucleotidyltransferase/poly(A) polymerase